MPPILAAGGAPTGVVIAEAFIDDVLVDVEPVDVEPVDVELVAVEPGATTATVESAARAES
jgi:hypothetical protein